jgi:hypothetical protein
MAWKQETRGNETGNETVSTIKTRNFIRENEDLRKQGNVRGRKRNPRLCFRRVFDFKPT